MNDLLRRLARATEPGPAALDRLRRHFAPPSAGAALRQLDTPDAASLARLRARVRPPPRRAGPRSALAVLAALGLAGGAGWVASEAGALPGPLAPAAPALAVADAAPVGPAPRVDPAPPLLPPAPAPVAAPLPAAPRPVARALPLPTPRAPRPSLPAPAVVVDPAPALVVDPPVPTALAVAPSRAPVAGLWLPEGVEATRSGREARVRWEVGRLEARLDGGDAALVIETREGHTRFEDAAVVVERDRLGTRVSVARGDVWVSCGGAPPLALAAPASTTCVPVAAAGWLGRAEALRERSAGVEPVLAAVDAGLALDPDPSTRAELVAIAVDVLLAADAPAEARRRAAAYPSDGPRAAEMARLRRR